ncbi:MerR family transcriptional regulator [Streptomyces sp. NPDC057067]|uniref:MerR family transcriptional regulator n=1 Tax=unclassified Streptomyces TaxID=2593676 RepID=UPI003645156D
MRIGELAARAGASSRQVRFYEAKGLITSTREANNYRDYSETALGHVQQIRELLDAGLSTQLIRAILPCLEYRATRSSSRVSPPGRWRRSNRSVTG